jgi:hypothetical protein
MGALRCEELAARMGISARAVFVLLDEELDRGNVERDGRGRFRLTGEAERRYGQALRDLTPADPQLVRPPLAARAARTGRALPLRRRATLRPGRRGARTTADR